MQKTKILIVEDEIIVALDIKATLQDLGFEVVGLVTNYEDALCFIKKQPPDVLLSDINLKDSKSGIDIARDIQKITYIPVIYLTAFSDEETIAEAVKTNPVAYITKPFKREDLKSNILLAQYKIHRQNKTQKPLTCKRLGNGFYFCNKDKVLYFEDMLIKLSIKEKELLSLLVEANGQIVSFSSLEYFIWPHNPISDSALRTLIYRLRAKLEYKLIETIPSVGCKINFFY